MSDFSATLLAIGVSILGLLMLGNLFPVFVWWFKLWFAFWGV